MIVYIFIYMNTQASVKLTFHSPPCTRYAIPRFSMYYLDPGGYWLPFHRHRQWNSKILESFRSPALKTVLRLLSPPYQYLIQIEEKKHIQTLCLQTDKRQNFNYVAKNSWWQSHETSFIFRNAKHNNLIIFLYITHSYIHTFIHKNRSGRMWISRCRSAIKNAWNRVNGLSQNSVWNRQRLNDLHVPQLDNNNDVFTYRLAWIHFGQVTLEPFDGPGELTLNRLIFELLIRCFDNQRYWNSYIHVGGNVYNWQTFATFIAHTSATEFSFPTA